MAVTGFNRDWYDRRVLAPQSPMPREAWNGLSEREQQLLQYWEHILVE